MINSTFSSFSFSNFNQFFHNIFPLHLRRFNSSSCCNVFGRHLNLNLKIIKFTHDLSRQIHLMTLKFQRLLPWRMLQQVRILTFFSERWQTILFNSKLINNYLFNYLFMGIVTMLYLEKVWRVLLLIIYLSIHRR